MLANIEVWFKDYSRPYYFMYNLCMDHNGGVQNELKNVFHLDFSQAVVRDLDFSCVTDPSTITGCFNSESEENSLEDVDDVHRISNPKRKR